jgi:hypothetical protein
MDPMHRLERMIKIMAALITLAFVSLIGARILANRSSLHLPNPKRDCEVAGRVFDTQHNTCLPPGRTAP